MAAMPSLPPGAETERGGPGGASQSGWPDLTHEATAMLRWPQSAAVYDAMRRQDGRVAAVLRALTLPLRRARWSVTGDDVDPSVLGFVQACLGLQPEQRGRRRRDQQGIRWNDHLRHALLMLPLGFMPFEQVYGIGPPSERRRPEGDTGPEGMVLPDQVAWLRKLGPRFPRTITQIDVAADGGLRSYTQHLYGPDPAAGGRERWHDVVLPVDRLAVYVNDREGGDWTGNSILRAAYRDWLIKDRLLRLGPMIAERNGMGLPVVGFAEGPGAEQRALEIAKRARAGAESGIALPGGFTFKLEGVSGGTEADLVPLLTKYHDEAIAGSVLAMFLTLGHDRGARSLGDTFVDFFALAVEAVADEICETTTEHVIRDLCAVNFGDEEAYPELSVDGIAADAPVTADAIKSLIESGALRVDDPLRVRVRETWGLPPEDAATAEQPPAPSALPGAPAIGIPSDLPIAAAIRDRLRRADAALAALD